MKQLLDTIENLIVAGLNDRAFVVRQDSSVCELLPPEQEAPEKKDDHVTRQAKTTAEQNKDGSVPKKGCSQSSLPNHNHRRANEIQAVAITSFDDDDQASVWCAVSRHNKTLSLYCLLRQSGPSDASQKLPQTILPTTVHKTAKRALCLAFTTVPCASNTSTRSTSSSDDGSHASSSGLHIVIAGDLVGDATAYSLTNDPASSRVLLGHTASLLSGLVCVSSIHNKSRRQHVLTCDRDEKIRVSAFPQTFVIEGYLLGHTSFITSLDAPDCALESSSNTCVSCGGDGTVRLWHYVQCKEIATYETSRKDQQLLLPSRVSMSPNGMHVAVIYDASDKLDLLSTGSGTMLKLQQCIQCPSQPLSVKFASDGRIMVLTRDPEYLLEYNLDYDTSGRWIVGPPSHSSLPVHALQKAACSCGIQMPTTIMEFDESSGRLKMEKQDETRGVKGDLAPWNKVERIQTAKEASMRRSKRRRQQHDETQDE